MSESQTPTAAEPADQAESAPTAETLEPIGQRPEERAVVRMKPGKQKRLLGGHPWAYSNEIDMTPEAKALPLGCIVRLEDSRGEALGTALFNRLPLIAVRLLTQETRRVIDAGFLADRLERALMIRERLFDAPYYRLIHAEADGLPGTIVDRFGETLVLQINTAGMERLRGPLVEALDRLLQPSRILLRSEGAARQMEGLGDTVGVLRGAANEPLELIENGARYLADLGEGQKTGWFYDQRESRAWVARFAGGARVLEGYCYTGGFTVQAALAGAREVLALDRSEPALVLAERAAQMNGVEGLCRFERAEVFAQLQRLHKAGERFELVMMDPPAFIKSRKDYAQGAKGYRKLARLAAQVTAPRGILFIASCSHHITPEAFAQEIHRGLQSAGRQGRILRAAGAGPDHPVHPALNESAYLKSLVLALD